MEEEHWSAERAESHARWAKLGARFSYAPLASLVAERLSSREGAPIVLELGTGPGVLAVELAKVLPQAAIIGVDVSPEMLEIADSNADEAGVPNFEARAGSAEEIPAQTESVDLVITQSSFHEWDDRPKALDEILRVLVPGGRLIIKDYDKAWLSGVKRLLVALLRLLTGEKLGMFRVTLGEAEDLVRRAGFVEVTGRRKGTSYLLEARKAEIG